jgi:hypothetical protein
MSGDWRQHIPQRFLRLIAAPWTLCLIVGSLLPDHIKEVIGTHSHHRPYHFIAFGATALLFLLISSTRRQDWIALGGAFALGVTLETLQFLLDGYFEWWDLRDDALGILLAFALFRMADRWLSMNRAANT